MNKNIDRHSTFMPVIDKKYNASQWTKKQICHSPAPMHPETLNDKCDIRRKQDDLYGREAA